MAAQPNPMRFSLIIPAYNEARYLPALLDSVDAARAAYARGAQAVEVIVVNNASTDRTAEVATERGCRVIYERRRCIAAARNAGACEALGEVLAFVDADTQIHPQTFDAIDKTLAGGRVIAGATGVTLDRWSPGRAMTYAMMLPVVWLTGMDTGVVFCKREDFDAVSGYDESRRIAEDVTFLLALRRLGRRRAPRRRLGRAKRVKAVTSTRKFDEHGEWHWLTMMSKLPVAMLLKHRWSGEFIDRYWYRPRR